MRRTIVVTTAVALLPLAAWGAAVAGPQPPVDCTSTTTTTTTTTESPCVPPAPGAPIEPVPAPSPTTPPRSTPPPTDPGTSPPDSSAPSSVPGSDPTTPDSSTPDSSAPDTTPTTPGSSDPTDSTDVPGTTPPGSSIPDTTPTTPEATTTTVEATTTTTAPPPPPDEDIESQPVEPPVEAPGGRVVVPDGAVESGQVRPIVFPVAGPVTYGNDWGACRDGCRRAHKGNDLIGDRLQPVLAMHDGVVDHLVDHPTAGYGVVIRDEEGWEYHVYHLNNDTPGTDDGADDGTWRVLPGIEAGVRVTAGQQLGWMGDSGNSEGSVPHAHVEIHTPEGRAINPFWSLRAAQRAHNCAVGTVGLPDPAESGEPTGPGGGAEVAVEALGAPSASLDTDAAVSADAAAAEVERATTTLSAASAAPAGWLETGWQQVELPAGWRPFTVTGGRPNTQEVAARFWISTQGFTPVDAAALRVGDPRYDEGVDCRDVGTDTARVPADLAVILATIRYMESGGNYTVEARGSTASGAYGFLDSSWGGYGGYARAKDAPPAVQDAKAAELVAQILARNGGDVSTVPVTWYIGHVPVGDEWDTVPKPEAGNRITPREYQRRWMNRYRELLGRPDAWTPAAVPAATVDTSATCRTIVIDVGEPGKPQYALSQGQSFLVHPDGRAVPNAHDPCDPGRALLAAPPPASPEEAATLTPRDLLAELGTPATRNDRAH